MDRRRFMRISAAAAAVVAVPAGFVAGSGFDRAARGIILRELNYLRHDPAGIDRFIAEYFDGSSAADRMKVRLLHAFRRDAQQSWSVADMSRQYLLGSDFFRNGMDEAKPVTFHHLHDPYAGGCTNPFAMLYYPRA